MKNKRVPPPVKVIRAGAPIRLENRVCHELDRSQCLVDLEKPHCFSSTHELGKIEIKFKGLKHILV